MKIDGRITYNLVEMLQLRASGWRHQELAIKYGRERTTLHHQCQKWGVVPGSIVWADSEGVPVVDNSEVDKFVEMKAIAPLKKEIEVVIQNERKREVIPPPKYAHLLEDKNPGKSYAEYMAEARQRESWQRIDGRYLQDHRLDHEMGFSIRDLKKKRNGDSSNGRTRDFGSLNVGSIPTSPAMI